MNVKRVLRRATAVAALAAAVVGAAGVPAAAEETNEVCRVVKNNDGRLSFSACVHIGPSVQGKYLAWDWKVWNIPLAKGGHSDILTRVTWHGTTWPSGEGSPRTVSWNFGNIDEGATDEQDVGWWEVPDNTTVWVEVHDPFAPTCQRVFFNVAHQTSVTAC